MNNQNVDFARFYSQEQKRKHSPQNWNAFIQDDEISLLSNNSLQVRMRQRMLNEESHCRFRYLAMFYSFVSIVTVLLGINNFWVQEDRKYYFYDAPFMTSEYFTVSVIMMGLVGTSIQIVLFQGYSKKNIQHSVSLKTGPRVSFHSSAFMMGVLSQICLIAFAVLPADNEFNKHSLTAHISKTYFVLIRILRLNILEFAPHFQHDKRWIYDVFFLHQFSSQDQTTIDNILILDFNILWIKVLSVNAINEFTVQKIYGPLQEKAQLLLPYIILLMEGLFMGTLSGELGKINLKEQLPLDNNEL